MRPITVETHETGLALTERYDFSIYDAMIAASALHAECDTLWSEDMHDGIVIQDRLRSANAVSPRLRTMVRPTGHP